MSLAYEASVETVSLSCVETYLFYYVVQEIIYLWLRWRESNSHHGFWRPLYCHCTTPEQRLARLAGLEPATYGLEGRYSIQLSYSRIVIASQRKSNLIIK